MTALVRRADSNRAHVSPHLYVARGQETFSWPLYASWLSVFLTPHGSLYFIYTIHLHCLGKIHIVLQIHTHIHTSTLWRPASFPHCLCEAPISAITALHPRFAILSFASSLYPRVMNNCPSTRSWVHLQKWNDPFLNTCFECAAQFLPGESIEQRMKDGGSISHGQEAQTEPHQAVARTHTQD